MNYLNLSESQFAVGKAEYSTGIVLKNNGSPFQQGDSPNEVFEIFESLDEAKEFVMRKVNLQPSIECYITDFRNELVFAYNKEGELLIGK